MFPSCVQLSISNPIGQTIEVISPAKAGAPWCVAVWDKDPDKHTDAQCLDSYEYATEVAALEAARSF